MDCSACRRIIPLVPGGELDSEIQAQALAHIQECDQCRKEYEQYTALRDTLAELKDMDDVRFNWEQFSADTVEKAFQKRKTDTGSGRTSVMQGSNRYFRFFMRAAVLLITAGLFFTAGTVWKSHVMSEQDSEEYADVPAQENESAAPDRHIPAGEPLRELEEWEIPRFLKEKYSADDLEYSAAVPKDITFSSNKDPEIRTGLLRSAWLGMYVQDTEYGVTVKGIVRGGPSHGSGIAAGDVIISCAGRHIANRDELCKILASIQPGNRVILVIKRHGTKRNITVTAAAPPHHL